MTEGWVTPTAEHPAPEDIAANLDQIRSTDSYVIPDSIAGEMGATMEALKKRGEG